MKIPPFSAELARQLMLEYHLTYRCSINLRATIEKMLECGLNTKQIGDILVDIYDNVDFIPEPVKEKPNAST